MKNTNGVAGLAEPKVAIQDVTVKLSDGSEATLTPEIMQEAMVFLSGKLGMSMRKAAEEAEKIRIKRRAAVRDVIERSWHRLIHEELEGVDPELTRHDVFLMLSETIPWDLVGDYASEPNEETAAAWNGLTHDERKAKWGRRREAMAKYVANSPQFEGIDGYFDDNRYVLLAPFTEPFGRVTEYQACLLLIPWLEGHLDYLEERMIGWVSGEIDDPHDWTEIDL